MGYKELRQEKNKAYKERLDLVMERIAQIAGEKVLAAPYDAFFREQAGNLLLFNEIAQKGAEDAFEQLSAEEGAQYNRMLYEDIRVEAYETSYGNPSYAQKVFGAEYGKIFCELYEALRSCIPTIFQGNFECLCIYAELFVEMYNDMENGEVTPAVLLSDRASFAHDYLEIFTEASVRRMVDPADDYFTTILMEADLSEPAYLYRYGYHIGDNERRISEYLNTFPEEEIRSMADTYTEGYRIGFEVTGKDLAKKTTVEVRYPIGFERMVRAAVDNFKKMNLSCVAKPFSTDANKQYSFDHKEDRALWLDKAFVERGLETLRCAFEKKKTLAGGYAGPAVVEVFGEEPFSPQTKPVRISYDKKQQQLAVYENSRRSQIINEYIVGEERSFTIIAYPVPQIGERFEEIFAETVTINTLDYQKYQTMQQKLIDVLDTADRVHIVGANGNRTDLYVNLYKLGDPAKETIFENCVADVNIPVGEVFTSPVLENTNGKLHVSQVYLNELNYENLEIDFKDGMIERYTCSNFDTEEENKNYIFDNVLMHHETLPMGEFAIGTNTTAFRMARVYDIAAKLPILIAEKTGPHFAVGDTCYTYDEENMTYNPDGKAIVARDNEVSILRKEDVSKAYFNCHTDITIPYDELGAITVIRRDGSTEDIIRNGRFVVPGTEELNKPLEDL